MLSSSPSFRVRAQAAVALSHQPSDGRTLAALRTALKDKAAPVREASAAALVSLEGQNAAGTRTAGRAAKFYVHIGEPSAKTSISPVTLRAMRVHVADLVAKLEGVRLAPDHEGQAAAELVLARDSLAGFSVESVVNSLERRGDVVRVNVAVVIATYPGRSIQAMLSGSASVSGRGDDDAAQRTAAEAAFASALRRLPTFFDASGLEASVLPVETGRSRSRARHRHR